MTATAIPATNQHYDQDPDVFARFLDPLRKYSSGLFESPDDTLEQAQRNKLAFVARELDLSGGERVLDVGCGWGALITFMAAEYGCRTVGISPAARQHDYIAKRVEELGLGELVRTEVASFETYQPDEGGYDAVTLLGSIVHMANPRAVFTKARKALRRGGRLYVSESCFRNQALRESFDTRPGTEFVRSSIFGSGDLRPLSELVEAAEDAGFSIKAVHDLTDHYKRTIEHWSENLRAVHEPLNELSTGLGDQLLHYLDIANAGWGYTTKHYALVCANSR
ncbi:class I SAM-dependent methyltransferase [Actinosynnema sp. NPDC020468]|uniref:SAM-dependent methyltransferase n=1 Tax=Actinosynnema sp. NPDC020468 TaxID=3154488 RepID=UPI0033E0A25A